MKKLFNSLCQVSKRGCRCLRELRPGTVKLSLRTGPRVNATEVCRLLGGGGHAAAAGATVSGTMAQAKSAVLAAIAQVIGPLAP